MSSSNSTNPTNNEMQTEESGSEKEDRRCSHLVIDISKMFESLGPPLSAECCIYRVPMKLRQVNEAAYTPLVVSIGPFHHNQDNLKNMEKHKLRYLQAFLQRAVQSAKLKDFVSFLTKRENSIRSCYAEIFDDLDSDKFIKMILIDAAFIIEHFLRSCLLIFLDQNDLILYKPWLQGDIMRDFILLENQLPFFVLEELYHLAFPSCPLSFRKLSCHFFSRYNNQNKSIENIEIKHFTDLLRSLQLQEPPPPQILNDTNQTKCIQKVVKRFVDLLMCCLFSSCRSKPQENGRFHYVHSITELSEAGVKLELSSSECILDIKFINGELKIPCLKLYDPTESFIRNLMALEQCHYPFKTNICDYIVFMDNLINTANDVSLLVRKRILVNGLGDNEAVASMFNKLCINITRVEPTYYSTQSNELNEYYEIPRHSWKALLKNQYFSSPWRGASTIAAFILLVFTLIQTICSLISL